MLNYDAISIVEATALQNELRHRVSLHTGVTNISTIAGGDISHDISDNILYAAIVILSFPDLKLLSYSLVRAETKFPYVTHYLGFREVPALLQAWEQIPEKPDCIVLDGQGVMHPRRFGIASHFGVLAGHPSIGCAKRLLFGSYKPLGLPKLSTSPITDEDEVIGHALRTKELVKPVYISPGHQVSITDSIQIMKQCVLKHRIPEPTRIAYDKVNLFRVGHLREGFHKVDLQSDMI